MKKKILLLICSSTKATAESWVLVDKNVCYVFVICILCTCCYMLFCNTFFIFFVLLILHLLLHIVIHFLPYYFVCFSSHFTDFYICFISIAENKEKKYVVLFYSFLFWLDQLCLCWKQKKKSKSIADPKWDWINTTLCESVFMHIHELFFVFRFSLLLFFLYLYQILAQNHYKWIFIYFR